MSKKQQKKCTGCITGTPAPGCTTCKNCQERGKKNRDKKRESNIICKGKTKQGNDCISKVSSDYGNVYCKKHRLLWIYRNDVENKTIRCNSRRQCKGSINGEKAKLTEGYLKSSCQDCLDVLSKIERNKRNDCNKQNIEYKQNGVEKKICQKCPEKNKLHDINDMGVSSNGVISDKCKYHFAEQQKNENNRVRDVEKERVRRREYEKDPRVIIMRREYRKNNPDKSYISYTNYRARKLSIDPEKYRKRNAETHKEWANNNPEKITYGI